MADLFSLGFNTWVISASLFSHASEKCCFHNLTVFTEGTLRQLEDACLSISLHEKLHEHLLCFGSFLHHGLLIMLLSRLILDQIL
jgi:hypothetical protein